MTVTYNSKSLEQIWMKFGMWLGYDPRLNGLTFCLDLDIDPDPE